MGGGFVSRGDFFPEGATARRAVFTEREAVGFVFCFLASAKREPAPPFGRAGSWALRLFDFHFVSLGAVSKVEVAVVA